MMNLIKTFDANYAQALKNAGFNYMTELINGETLYVFVETEELKEFLSNKFSGQDGFFVYNKLTF